MLNTYQTSNLPVVASHDAISVLDVEYNVVPTVAFPGQANGELIDNRVAVVQLSFTGAMAHPAV